PTRRACGARAPRRPSRRERDGGRDGAGPSRRVPGGPAQAWLSRDPAGPRSARVVPWRARGTARQRRSDRMTRPTTIGELRETGYRTRTVKEELRANLIAALAKKKLRYQVIVGYEATVMPQIEYAVHVRQTIIFP